MKGMGRVYDHVTPEMERQISEALEDRWVTSVLALDNDERERLLTWVPVVKDTIEKAQQEATTLAAKLVGGERFSQISPTGASNENKPGGESAPPGLLFRAVELRGFEPLTSSMPWTLAPPHRPRLRWKTRLSTSVTIYRRMSLLPPSLPPLDRHRPRP